MNDKPKIFFLIGETSGDTLASEVIESIKRERPDLFMYGVCGPKMRRQNVVELARMEVFQTIFPDSLIRLPQIYRAFCKIRNLILATNPKLCVFVDASSVSLNLARSLRTHGFSGKIIKYVAPNFMWKDAGRRKMLERHFDRLIVLFPHEEEFFKGSTLRVDYVGHPLVFGNVSDHDNVDGTLTLFPGSRPFLVKHCIHAQLAVAKMFYENYPQTKIVISCASPDLHSLIEKAVKELPIEIVATQNAESKRALFLKTKAALALPGTINLELADYGIPSLIACPIPAWLRFLAQYRFTDSRTSHSLVNVVHRRQIFPELLLHEKFSEKKATKILSSLWCDYEMRNSIRKECESFINNFQRPKKDPSTIILEMLDV